MGFSLDCDRFYPDFAIIVASSGCTSIVGTSKHCALRYVNYFGIFFMKIYLALFSSSEIQRFKLHLHLLKWATPFVSVTPETHICLGM